MKKYLGSGVDEYNEELGLDFIFAPKEQSNEDIVVTISSPNPELTALCPANKARDFYTWTLSYAPNKRLIETKSLKLWFATFANKEVYAEALTDHIGKALAEFLEPRHLSFSMTQNLRGGMQITTDYLYQKPSSFNSPFLSENLFVES